MEIYENFSPSETNYGKLTLNQINALIIELDQLEKKINKKNNFGRRV